MMASAREDRFGRHRLVSRPEDADLILFAITPGERRDLLRHPFVGRFPDRCFVFDAYSGSLPIMAGVYGCLSASAHLPGRTAAGHYPVVAEHPGFDVTPVPEDAPFLFSFLGASRTSPLRRALLRLDHPRVYLRDTSPNGAPRVRVKDLDPEARARYYGSFVETLQASKFVLCPRGYGPSSLRLFEALRLGRAPVILADDWAPVPGPEWDAFSIRVPERELDALPALLEAREAVAPAMGRAAREAWEAWFDRPVSFHRIVEACLRLGRGGTMHTQPRFLRLLLNKGNLRSYMKHYVRGTESRGRVRAAPSVSA